MGHSCGQQSFVHLVVVYPNRGEKQMAREEADFQAILKDIWGQ